MYLTKHVDNIAQNLISFAFVTRKFHPEGLKDHLFFPFFFMKINISKSSLWFFHFYLVVRARVVISHFLAPHLHLPITSLFKTCKETWSYKKCNLTSGDSLDSGNMFNFSK